MKGGGKEVVVVDVGGENWLVVLFGLLFEEAVTEVAIEEGVRTFHNLTDQSRPEERARSERLSGPWEG